MAVADAERSDKTSKGRTGARASRPGSPTPWAGGLESSRKAGTSSSEVRAELKKVTWPSRTEVHSTTIVVIATTVFFGFYLWLLDLGFSRVLSHLLKG